MNKILITGGCGYLGARISKYLVQKGLKVTVLDLSIPSENKEWTSLMDEVILGDIRDEDLLSKLAEKKFDAVIHLISLDHRKSEDNPNFVNSINVMPTWNLLDKFSKYDLKKFIYFSTFQVYGKVPSKEIAEDFLPSPQNNYGLTHLLSENICNYYNRKTNINCINVRLSNSYGSPILSNDNCWGLVVNDLCKSAYIERKIVLKSDGTPQRDFLHGNDIFRAIELLIKRSNNNINGNIYHLSSGETKTILELAFLVKSVFQSKYGKEIPIFNNLGKKLDDREFTQNQDKFIIDNTKIKGLGFIQEIDLQRGIMEIFNYLERENAKK